MLVKFMSSRNSVDPQALAIPTHLDGAAPQPEQTIKQTSVAKITEHTACANTRTRKQGNKKKYTKQ